MLRLFKLQKPISIKSSIGEIFSILIPLLIYWFVLSIDIPSEFISPIRYDFSLFLLGIVAVLWLTYAVPGLLGRTLALSTTLILFALALTTLWSTGASEAFTIGGLFPFSDAHGFYTNARRLLEGNQFQITILDQRPLATGALATILGLTQQNLQLTQAVLVAIVGLTCFVMAREVQRHSGTLTTVLVVLGVFTFYRVFAGSVMTENWGLPLGFLGFAALWRGARLRQANYVYLGLFLLTLGILARPSAIAVLPFILIWGGFVFRRSQSFSWRFAIRGLGSILLAFFVSSILQKLLVPQGAIPFSNFSYTFYGIVTKTDWFQVFRDYPELKELPPAEQPTKVYGLVWKIVQSNPSTLFTGILRTWQEFFFGASSMFFVYRQRGFLDFALGILSVVGLFACCRRLRDPNSTLLLAFTIGVVASMPILPIWDAGLRPYATVLTIFYLLPAMGISYLFTTIWSSLHRLTHENRFISSVNQQINVLENPRFSDTSSLFLVGVLVTCLVFLGPIFIKLTSHPSAVASYTCPTGLEARYFKINSGSSLHLAGRKRIENTHVPNIQIADFKRGIEPLKIYQGVWEGFSSLNGRQIIVDTDDRVWLIAKPAIVPKTTGPILACGKLEQYGELSIFRAETIRRILDN